MLEDLLAREVAVDAVLERHGDVGQAVKRDRAQDLQPGRAIEGGLERNGDEPLDFLAGVARPLCDHFDGGRGEIGIGIDRKLREGPDAPGDRGEREREHDEMLAKRVGDQSEDHLALEAVGELNEERAIADDLVARGEAPAHNE